METSLKSSKWRDEHIVPSSDFDLLSGLWADYLADNLFFLFKFLNHKPFVWTLVPVSADHTSIKTSGTSTDPQDLFVGVIDNNGTIKEGKIFLTDFHKLFPKTYLNFRAKVYTYSEARGTLELGIEGTIKKTWFFEPGQEGTVFYSETFDSLFDLPSEERSLKSFMILGTKLFLTQACLWESP